MLCFAIPSVGESYSLLSFTQLFLSNFQPLPFKTWPCSLAGKKRTDICSQIEVSRDDGLLRLTAGFHAHSSFSYLHIMN